ncbi:NAD(P)H-dependent oxidoreductase [Janibacter melonis]|uniref:NAD(P)H-dependent oxidoreductase n=1 Tax=Janibacter melonis TaxID=262209 RepID=UPI003558883C
MLKTFLDLLPQDALRGKVVLPVATGGSPAHVLSVDYALRPVLASLAPSAITPDGSCGPTRCTCSTAVRSSSTSPPPPLREVTGSSSTASPGDRSSRPPTARTAWSGWPDAHHDPPLRPVRRRASP